MDRVFQYTKSERQCFKENQQMKKGKKLSMSENESFSRKSYLKNCCSIKAKIFKCKNNVGVEHYINYA